MHFWSSHRGALRLINRVFLFSRSWTRSSCRFGYDVCPVISKGEFIPFSSRVSQRRSSFRPLMLEISREHFSDPMISFETSSTILLWDLQPSRMVTKGANEENGNLCWGWNFNVLNLERLTCDISTAFREWSALINIFGAKQVDKNAQFQLSLGQISVCKIMSLSKGTATKPTLADLDKSTAKRNRPQGPAWHHSIDLGFLKEIAISSRDKFRATDYRAYTMFRSRRLGTLGC